ncbi:MAG: hypothetical protein ACTSXS_05435 [Candidatus Thorarchaeota archaeon]
MADAVYEEEKIKVFDWKVIIAVAVIYSLNAFLLDSASSLFPHDERIAIMVPAFASVIFGPLIGGLGTGFGNLLFDIFDKMVLSQEGLAARHVLGFFANMIGAMVTGFYSKRIAMKEDDAIFTKDKLLLVIRNTFASVLGLAVITGVMIGYGRWLLTFVGLDTYTLQNGLWLTGIIVTSNGFVLLVSMIPLQLAFMFIERRRITLYNQMLQDSRKMVATHWPRKVPFSIDEFKGTGHGFVLRSWSTLRLRVRNKLDFPMRYRVEVRGQDHVDPNVFYTEKIPPGGVDVVNLQLYPFDDADRKIQLVFRPWVDQSEILRRVFEENTEFMYEYSYSVMLPGNRRFRVLISLIGIMALIAGIAQALRSIQSIAIGETGGSSSAFFATLGVVLVEVIFVLLWYYLKKRQLEV